MQTYQTADSSGEFYYELTYSQDPFGFRMHSICVKQGDQIKFQKKQLGGFHKTEALLLAQGINMCEAVANHFRAEKSETP